MNKPPSFTFKGYDGNNVSISKFEEKPVITYLYPADAIVMTLSNKKMFMLYLSSFMDLAVQGLKLLETSKNGMVGGGIGEISKIAKSEMFCGMIAECPDNGISSVAFFTYIRSFSISGK